MNRNDNSGKKKILVILLLLLLLVVIIIAIFIDSRKEKPYIIPDFTYEGIDYKKKDNIDLLFFTGVDSLERYIAYNEPYQNDYGADAIVIFVLDKKNKTITPIHINTELMCDYDLTSTKGEKFGDIYGQVNYSHAFGSGGMDSLLNVKDTVRKFMTGVSIEYYISVPMNVVPKVNDSFHYVDVYVEDDFKYIDPSLVQYEYNTLIGSQALTFVTAKSGVGDESNISRMKRNKVYFDALFDKVRETSDEDPNIIMDTINSISDDIVSNADVYELSDLVNEFIEYDVQEAVMIEGKLEKQEDDTYCYILDERDTILTCIDYFYNRINY